MNVLIREQQLDAVEVTEKETEYLKYIVDHKNNVKKAFENIFLSNYEYIETNSISNNEFRLAIDNLKDEIDMHDSSKLGDLEFHAYRVKHYPTSKEKENMNSDPIYADEIYNKYNEAWIHHIIENDHHGKHWKVVNGEYNDENLPRDMELKSIIHMICDWMAMSYHFKNDMWEWYENADEKNDLSETTLTVVNEILNKIKSYIS